MVLLFIGNPSHSYRDIWDYLQPYTVNASCVITVTSARQAGTKIYLPQRDGRLSWF